MKRKMLILMLAACVLLGGCSVAPTGDALDNYVLPTPDATETQEILGESIEYEPVSVTFHYISGDGTSFSTIKRFMTPTATENFCETVLETLMSSPSFASQMSFVPDGTKITDVEYANGIVTVSLSPDALNTADETETLMMLACLTNTLLSIPDVQGVNLLIAGRPVSISDLPIGIRTEAYAGIATAYAQLNTENSYFLEQFTGTISRSAVLYFPLQNGDWLVPELREIEFNSTDYASQLIRALREGSGIYASAAAPLPEGTDLLISNPTTEISNTGERVLVLNFSSEILNYFAMVDLPEWKAFASIVLTVTSFVPNIDAVRITLDGEVLNSCKIGDSTVNFTDGLIHRTDFAARIGGAFTVYLPNSDGTLHKTESALSMQQSQSPLCVLRDIFAQSSDFTSSASLSGDDLLGLSVADSVCTINLSASFYRKALKMSAKEERAWVYAVVNSLCAFNNIQGVRFLAEGNTVESIAGEIYFATVLLPVDDLSN